MTMLEKKYKTDAFTCAIQDGKAAGQTVPHVHLHILPRRPNDFAQNDDIYDALDNKKIASTKVDSERKPRDAEEMYAEALEFRGELARLELSVPTSVTIGRRNSASSSAASTSAASSMSTSASIERVATSTSSQQQNKVISSSATSSSSSSRLLSKAVNNQSVPSSTSSFAS
eukprot:TRINITY_DN3241_c1_g1_i1.p1 TRINITY_DN3241_c1_g1~~TRINITY_DN3241_c1_g1_i1.p1  ORF type:complete len:172 (+),score=52.93 TRINITY_DN3241_c1_g1_i1:692-1207(+)